MFSSCSQPGFSLAAQKRFRKDWDCLSLKELCGAQFSDIRQNLSPFMTEIRMVRIAVFLLDLARLAAWQMEMIP